MLTIEITVEEYLDKRKLEGAKVEVEVEAVPRFLRGLTDPNDPEPEPDVVAEPDFDRARRAGTVRATTDDQGFARLTLDVAAAFADAGQLRRNGAPPFDVVAVPRYRVTYANLKQSAYISAPLASLDSPALNTDPDGTVEQTVRVDLGFAIVGHVTQTTAKIWATTTGKLSAGLGLEAVVEQAESPVPMTRSVELDRVATSNPDQRVLVGEVTGLVPAKSYTYAVLLTGSDPDPVTVTRGTFLTDGPGRDQHTFAFGSCHDPFAGQFRRWQALARERDLDAVLFMGDQIYGDLLEKPWFESYSDRYRLAWLHPAVRQTLRSNSTYMIFDDHEVDDDWGVRDIEAVDPGRIAAALRAFKLFQQSHGPHGASDSFHYSFRRGPAACFVLDCRSRRVTPPPEALKKAEDAAEHWNPPASTLLGSVQLGALEAWADDPSTRDADVIFLVASIPPAWVAVSTLLEYIDTAEQAAAIGGALTAGGLLGLILGPAGALVGAVGGAAIGGEIVDEEADHFKGEGIITAADAGDLWTWSPHQRDLQRMLDVAFALGNDLNLDGTARPNPRPRAVFILSGDVHAGGLHVIRSNLARHRRNPIVTQVTSSSLSRPGGEFSDYLAEFLPGGISLSELISDFVAGRRIAARQSRFVLDEALDGRYEAQFVDLVNSHNYGKITIKSLGDRRYEILVEVLGEGENIRRRMTYDLDAASVRPESPAPPGQLRVRPTRISFGDVAVGDIATRPVIVTKQLNRPVTVNVAARNQQPITWQGRQTTLQSGASFTVPVDFMPGGAGRAEATLVVSSDAPNDTVQVTLSGRGVAGGPGPGDPPRHPN